MKTEQNTYYEPQTQEDPASPFPPRTLAGTRRGACGG